MMHILSNNSIVTEGAFVNKKNGQIKTHKCFLLTVWQGDGETKNQERGALRLYYLGGVSCAKKALGVSFLPKSTVLLGKANAISCFLAKSIIA